MREINHLSVHQWIRSAIRESQQPTSPIGFLFLKLPPRLVRYYWYNVTNLQNLREFTGVTGVTEECSFPFPKTKATKSVPRETWKVCAAKDPTSIVVWFCLCGRTVQKVQHEFRMNSEHHKWLQRNAADSFLCDSKWHYTTQHRTSPSERCLRRCTAIVTL